MPEFLAARAEVEVALVLAGEVGAAEGGGPD
jgi:hypothetical protein